MTGQSRGDRGAATAEFAMLASLVCVLMLVAIQLAFALHMRNTATAHVIEGARHGARADSTAAQGAARAQDLMQLSLPNTDGIQVSADRTVVNGVEIVEITASLSLPVFGPFGPADGLTVTGQAFAEDQ